MFKVILKANGNPDHMENPYKVLYDSEKRTSDTIDGCRKIVREFIELTGIGAGNWSGGHVYDSADNFVGYISYNGRFWEKGHPYAQA